MSGGHILLVDSDRSIWQGLGRSLEREGYTVACSPDGRDALGRVADRAPDAILLDPMLPGMTGHQFLRRLGSDLGRADIPVVVMTAVRGLNVKQALSMGASDVIEKPIDTDVLLNKVALALFRARRDRLRRARCSPGCTRSDDLVLLVSRDQRSLAELIRGHGHRVLRLVRVTSELPRLARVLEPRAILLDMRVPAAMIALHRLRAERALDGVPIAMLSGDPMELAREGLEIAALGAVGLRAPPDERALDELLAAPGRAAAPTAGVV